ncbi:MAG: succinylglutamate desuccinylase/aspartoacylase family protein [Chlamydiales bacterium]|nr:succinylglutamate desuccinylase/aspartoacylase family protein [Chlamydiales bacterium]
MTKNAPIKISNITIHPGERTTVALPTPELYTCAPIYIPIHVIHGKKAGPTLLVCGAMHGDEINGVAITQRLLKLRQLNSIKGTLIVVPTINMYGLITMSRNLPDRRDLDGSFPGSESGSFASRLAYFLTQEIFSHITHCIDLHTGEPHIVKFPQIKTCTDTLETKELANAFQAPVIINTKSEHGLLWLLHRKENPIPTIIYETGEALRLDEKGIAMGVRGIIRVMKGLQMLPPLTIKKTPKSVELQKEFWVRAPSSGLCEIFPKIGTYVKKGSLLAKIFDPFGTEQREEIFAPIEGVVIAKNHLPILNEGEPLLQIAEMKALAARSIETWAEDHPIE